MKTSSKSGFWPGFRAPLMLGARLFIFGVIFCNPDENQDLIDEMLN
jgi:hypothetical protein